MYHDKNEKKPTEEEDHQMYGMEIPETEGYYQEEAPYDNNGNDIEQEIPYNEQYHNVENFLSSGNEFQEVLKLAKKNDGGGMGDCAKIEKNNNTNINNNNNDQSIKPDRRCLTETTDKTYKEMLEQKIRRQAQRLCELQEYITTCEKRIKALSPAIPGGLNNNNNNKYLSSEIQLNSLLQSQKVQIQFLSTKLASKEKEIANLLKKHDALKLKYNHLIESFPRQTHLTISTHKHCASLNENSFPPLERLTSNSICETYENLLNVFKQTFLEKEIAVDSLKKEILCNDEQRNYIEILKQALENSILKHGLSHFMEAQKKQHYGGDSKVSNIDIVLDIVNLKNDAERNKEDLLKAEAMNTELKEELESMTLANAKMKAKIKESLDNGIQELEEAKERVKTLELEKDYLSDSLNEAREYSKKLIKDLEEMIEKSANEGKKIEENEKIISELQEDQNLLENKLGEYKTRFEKLTQEFEAVAIEKNKLEGKVKDLDVKYQSTLEENKIIKSQLETQELTSHKDSANLLTENEKLTKEYNDIKKELAEVKQNLEKDNQLLKNENNKLKSEKLQIVLENDKLKIDANEFNSNFNKILNQYENVSKLCNALKHEKENLSTKEMMMKADTDTDVMKKTISMLMKEKNDVKVYYTEQLENLKKEKNELEHFMNGEIEKMKDELTKSELKRNQIVNELSMKKRNDESEDKENYIRLLEDELKVYQKQTTPSCINVQVEAFDNIFHEVKLAIHSCLSVANVYMQKYHSSKFLPLYKKELDESYIKFSENNQDNKSLLESLRGLEDWINVVCTELEMCYGKIQETSANVKKKNNNLYENNIITTDCEIILPNKVSFKELQSYKNDNKKLYDQNKKLMEENCKLFFFSKENKFISHLLNRLTKFHLGGTVNGLVQELMSLNEEVLSLDIERSKLEKKMLYIEKQMNKNKNKTKNKTEVVVPAYDNECEYEISSLKASIRNLDNEINEKMEQMVAKDNEMKVYESESNNTFKYKLK